MKSMRTYESTVKQYARRIAKAKALGGNADFEKWRSAQSLVEIYGVDPWWAERDLDRWARRYQRAMGVAA